MSTKDMNDGVRSPREHALRAKLNNLKVLLQLGQVGIMEAALRLERILEEPAQ